MTNIIKIPANTRARLMAVRDEFGVWDFALTAAQRTYLYNSGAGRALY